MHTKTEFSMFKSTDINSVKQLETVLSERVGFVVGYEPYLKQRNLHNLFNEENKDAAQFITQYLSECDVNASNNLGMTLLHTLIWANRPDLSRMVIESPQFNKINYKFSLPVGMDVMYASALDLTIGFYLESPLFDLLFIELLLKHGAQLPDPTKKFLDSEFTSVFYPHIILDKEPETKSKEELIHLFCLLHRYGFSISRMEAELNKRLFSNESSGDHFSQEFEELYQISIGKQKTKFALFFDALKQKCEHIPVNGKVVVELTPERLDNGSQTLSLPFDPFDKPCLVM